MNQLISISFLASGGCEEWLNGNVEVGSSSVVAKISSSSSIKRCAGPICLRDDLLDNSRGEGSRPLHLSIYLVQSLSALGTKLTSFQRSHVCFDAIKSCCHTAFQLVFLIIFINVV